MTNTTSTTRAVDSYLATWNEFDPERRRALIESTWTEDGRYLDPHSAAEGRDGIDALIGAAQTHFPGHRIVLAAGPDAHNDRVRFTWHLLGPDGAEPLALGMDVATVAADGRIREVTGFRGPLD